MALRIDIIRIAKRRYAGIRRIVKHTGIGQACGEVLPRTVRWLSEHGVSPDGPPLVVYHSVNHETGDFDITPGYFVRESLASDGDFMIGETAEGEALRALHKGPYQGLGETWSAVFAHAEAMKRPVTKSSWESYLNLPGDVAEEELETEIVVPIDPA
jgi:effector-binding domain-containing protein